MFNEQVSGNVDAELLAECGQIAQRLRSLEKSWSFELKELQKNSLLSSHLPTPQLITSTSIAKKLNDILDIYDLDRRISNNNNIDEDNNNNQEVFKRIKFLEDTVIKIHYQQELLNQTKANQHNRSPLTAIQQQQQQQRGAYIKGNMNYSALSGGNSNSKNNDLSTSSQSSTAVIHEHHLNLISSSNNAEQQLNQQTTGSGDNNNKRNNDGGGGGGDEKNQSTKGSVSFSQQSIYHQKQQLCDQISEDDLKLLLRELKRKVDYTEKMNWLCLSNRPNPPTHRKSSLPKHSDVKAKFLEICHKTFSDDVKAALRLPSFDCYDWEDYEILHLMETMFIELNLIEKFHISPVRLREWLYEVYKHYNDVPFHNFRHCFCVSQMMYAITWRANLICRLSDMDVFILLISCICHDLDHPGYNNVYQINAKTELALRYNDISPLENHHCSIAFRLLEYPDCNLLENVTKDMYREIREGIIRCILATDMARHNEILTQFREIIPIFDYNNASHKNLLCMVLIKVADISNEARPMDVAEPWLDRLLQEFFAQSAAEKMEGLPVTPFMDPDKVSKPGSQVRFIGLVLLPLFESLGDLLPELIDFIIIPVRVALDFYKRLNDAQQKNRKSLVETEGSSEGDEIIPRSQSGISVRSRRSIPSQKSASRNSVDEESMLIAAELHDLPEGSESGDSETATEVDVAEKTSKFKVDTESRNKLNTQIIHRNKGHHRDKRPSMVSEMGGRMRGSYGNILQNNYNSRTNTFGNNRAISLDHYSNHRRMSDGIQTVTSDSTVYYHQRMHDQDNLLLRATATAINSTSMTSSPDVKLLISGSDMRYPPCVGSGIVNDNVSDLNRVHSSNNSNSNNNSNCSSNNHNNPSNINNSTTTSSSKSNLKSKVMSNSNMTAACTSNSPKSIITRLRQLTGRISFSFDKDNANNRNRATPQATVIKTPPPVSTTPSTMSKNNITTSKIAVDTRDRARAYSLDVPPIKFNYNSSSGASSNNGSHKSLSSSSNRNEELGSDKSSSLSTLKKLSTTEIDPVDL